MIMEGNIRKKTICWLIASVVLMLVIPWLTVTFVKSDAAMAVCLILFFGLDPMFSLLLGLSAGNDVKGMWFLPLLSAAFFLMGTWIFFDPGEKAFILYALFYLFLGMTSMFFSFFLKKKLGRE